MKKEMSKQQRWQKTKKDAGLCIGCGELSKDYLRCPKCRDKDRIAHIGMRITFLEPTEEDLDWARHNHLKRKGWMI